MAMETPTEIKVFQKIGEIVERSLETIKEASISDKMVELQAIVGSLLVLSIMFKGFQTIAGRNQDPIRDIIWDIGKKLLILTFILNVNGWLNLATSALDGFYQWAGGGAQFYMQLDELTYSFAKSLKIVWDKASGFDVIFAVFVMLFMTIGFLGVMIVFGFTMINATITNTFLIIALPIALFCLMYDFTKQAFNQWFNMFMSNIILLLLMSAFANFLTKEMSDFYTKGTDNYFLLIFNSIFVTAVIISIIQVIKSLASNLAQVSLDSAAQAGMGQGLGAAGKGIGMARGATGKTSDIGIKAWQGGASNSALKAATRGGVAGLAAYGAKRLAGMRNNIGKGQQ